MSTAKLDHQPIEPLRISELKTLGHVLHQLSSAMLEGEHVVNQLTSQGEQKLKEMESKMASRGEASDQDQTHKEMMLYAEAHATVLETYNVLFKHAMETFSWGMKIFKANFKCYKRNS
jgi:hypothetical protein